MPSHLAGRVNQDRAEVAGKPPGRFRRPVWASAGTAEDFLTVLLPLQKKFSPQEISDRAIWIFPKAGHRAMLVSMASFFREEIPAGLHFALEKLV